MTHRFTALLVLACGWWSVVGTARGGWEPVSPGLSGILVGIWGTAEDNLLVAHQQGAVMRFDGTAWTEMPGFQADWLSGIHGFPAGSVFAAGGTNYGSGQLLGWDGTAWSLLDDAGYNDLRGIWGTDPQHLIFPSVGVGTGGAIVHWDGTSLSPYGIGRWLQPNGVWGASATEAYAAGNSLADTNWVYRWNGTNWTEVFTGGERDLYDVWCGGGHVFAVGQSGAVVRYDGIAWAEHTVGLGADWRCVWGSSAGDVFIAGTGGAMCHWNGASWSNMASGVTAAIRDVWGLDAQRIWAVGENGTVLRYRPEPTPTASPPPTPPVPTPTASPPPTPPATPEPSATATRTPTLSPTSASSPAATETSTPAATPTARPTLTPPPTATPLATEAPAATATPLTLGARLELATTAAYPGGLFWVRGYLDNPGPAPLADTPVCFILDVFGALYFWPSWRLYDPPEQPDIDFAVRDVPAGSLAIDVVPAFVWPGTEDGQLTGLHFYGAMLDPGFSGIAGQWADAEWGYGPR